VVVVRTKAIEGKRVRKEKMKTTRKDEEKKKREREKKEEGGLYRTKVR